MVVNYSLPPVVLRLVAVLCAVMVVGIGAAGAAFAQDSEPSGDSSGGSIDSAEVEEQGEGDLGFDWLETGAGALSCASTAGNVVGALGEMVLDVDIPDCVDAAGNVVDAGTGAIEDGINEAAAGAVE